MKSIKLKKNTFDVLSKTELFVTFAIAVLTFTPVIFWYFKDHFALVADVAGIWQESIFICSGRTTFRVPPLILPALGCFFEFIFQGNIKYATIASVFVGHFLLLLVVSKISKLLKLSWLWTLAIVLNPVFYLQYVTFEFELLWHMAFFLGLFSFWRLWERDQSKDYMAFFAAWLIALESRPLLGFTFFCYLYFCLFLSQRSYSTHWNGIAFNSILLVTCLMHPHLFPYNLSLLILAITLYWFRGMAFDKLTKYGVLFFGFFYFWVLIRYPQLKPWLWEGVQRTDLGGFFYPLSEYTPSLLYFTRDIIFRLIGPIIIPLVLLAPFFWQASDHRRRVLLLLVPLLSVGIVASLLKNYAPHYFAAHAFAAVVGLSSLFKNSKWVNIFFAGVVVFNSIVFFQYALKIDLTESQNLSLFSPRPLAYKENANPIVMFFDQLNTSWLNEKDVLSIEHIDIENSDIGGRKYQLHGFVLYSNIFLKVPIRNVVNTSNLDWDITLNTFQTSKTIVVPLNIPLSEEQNRKYETEVNRRFKLKNLKAIRPLNSLGNGIVIPRAFKIEQTKN